MNESRLMEWQRNSPEFCCRVGICIGYKLHIFELFVLMLTVPADSKDEKLRFYFSTGSRLRLYPLFSDRCGGQPRLFIEENLYDRVYSVYAIHNVKYTEGEK